MKQTEELQQLINNHRESEKILKSKAHDYAQEDDCFSNFKKIAAFLDVSVEKVIMIFILIKVTRLDQIASKGKSAVPENTHETCMDASNYINLLDIYQRYERRRHK